MHCGAARHVSSGEIKSRNTDSVFHNSECCVISSGHFFAIPSALFCKSEPSEIQKFTFSLFAEIFPNA